MTGKDERPGSDADMRRRAEEIVSGKAAQSPEYLEAVSSPVGDFQGSPEEIRKALQRLRVHQVELEMQNEELRRAQAELEAARARYFDLYDLAPVGYLTVSEQGLILEANLTAATLLGVARGALVTRPITRCILPEDQDTYYLHRKQLFETGAPQDCDLRMLRQDGTQFWAHLAASAAQGDDSASPVGDFQGSPVCRVVMSDITDRKRAAEVLAFLAQTSGGTADEPFFNALARYLANSLQMDFVCIDRLEGDGLIARTVAVWCDGKFEDNVTYALKDTPCGVLVGQTVCCFPASVGQFFPRDQVLQDLRAESYVGVTLWSHTGQPIGLIAVIGRRPLANRSLAEATLKLVAVRAAAELERLDAEAALRESEAMLRRAQEITHIGHFRFNPATGTVEGSDELFRIFGLTREEFQVSDFAAAVRPDQRGYVVSTIQRAVAERTRYNIEHYLQPRDGTLKYVNAIGEVVAPSSTDQPVLVGTVQDITARKRAEEEKATLEAQLQQAQKMESVGRLAGGVAHDFNSMLQATLGNVELAMEDIPPGSPARERLEQIRICAQRSADLTQQLLAFARKQTIAPRVLDLNDTVEGTLKMLRPLIGENIDLAWRPTATLWPVKMDPSQIGQILATLCVNARDAIVGVGTLTIETGNTVFDAAYCADHAGFVPGEFVRLAISDNGCGMDKKTLEHIFEPFFTTKGVGKGTGLGLATVYGIVKQNNGFIHAHSEPGAGTTLTLYLPRHAGKVEPLRTEGAAAGGLAAFEVFLT